PGHIGSTKRDPAGGRRDMAREHAKQRCLTRPVWPYDAEYLALVDRERHFAGCMNGSECLAQSLDGEKCAHGRNPRVAAILFSGTSKPSRSAINPGTGRN